jgi:hypothetical protein
MIGLAFRLFGIGLMLVGFVLLVLAAIQHVDGLGPFAGVSHLAIYLGVAGVVLLAPGAWLALHRRRPRA